MDLDTSKLEVNFMPPATLYTPINGRMYTLTHSDTTAMRFLDVGIDYNYSAINQELRDELLGKWCLLNNNSYMLFFYAFIGNLDFQSASKKYDIFKYHIPSALEYIFYGDRYLLNQYKELKNTPIYIKFDSTFPMFNNYEYYGFIHDYML
ncbi:staygreen family protein [Romboutsia sp. 1001713B170207_170306_H8]|uniref:staygreen family protein n=1 Tax=Romboutsia sp. 1001713B170207_170306_H8 TaxID=2787112 RepID=UPI000822A2E3|nr:staygreen family protein [Romboutsia sp. 1001713B170207_170306_H8]SCH86539.1 Staygreen protein [uncultured Clostridium sp.]